VGEELLWQALADPTRRQILDLLREGPGTTGLVASRFPISRIAVMRHLDVLAAAGLVTSRKRGRERWHYVNLVPLLRLHERWNEPAAAGWARSLLRLGRHVEGDAVSDLAADVALDVAIRGSAAEVFAALTTEPGAWWGPPFLDSRATGLRIDARPGGLLLEDWSDGGMVLAQVTAIAPPRLLQLTGPFHFGVTLAIAEFAIHESGGEAGVAFTFRAIGALERELAGELADGWRSLVGERLKAYVETGTRLGIDPGSDRTKREGRRR
jgi:DNA-binding transcriptional ArsR family regulator/uncharacterized protein YndB with AHSA1/START domain